MKKTKKQKQKKKKKKKKKETFDFYHMVFSDNSLKILILAGAFLVTFIFVTCLILASISSKRIVMY